MSISWGFPTGLIASSSPVLLDFDTTLFKTQQYIFLVTEMRIEILQFENVFQLVWILE